MKSIKIVIMLLLLTTGINAQIVKVDRNYKTAIPTWAKNAPVNVKYYYLPDIKTYYDAPAKTYIYNNNGKWVRTRTLPSRYTGYNLRTSNPVYLTDYNGNAPYTLYKVHKVKYKGREWKSNGHDNGLHKGQHKGKGHGKGHEKD